MSYYICTTIIINAPVSKVWRILTYFENYRRWNPYLISVEGKLEVGSKLLVHILPPGGKGYIYKPIITTIKEKKLLVWKSKSFLSFLLLGKRKFELIENKDATTTFVHTEEVSGILTRFYDIQNNKNGMDEMNLQIKKLAEQM